MTASTVNRPSPAHAKRKRKYACRSTVFDGIPSTTWRGLSGVARTEPVWQMAQLRPTRSRPRTPPLGEPDGPVLARFHDHAERIVSGPGFATAGRCSGNISGRTFHRRKGTPRAVLSLPIEPYL